MGCSNLNIFLASLIGYLITLSTPVSCQSVPTETLVQTSAPIITIGNFASPVTFTAIVFSTSSGQPLGPSSGTVTFSVSGSDAFKWVKPTVLGTGVVSQDGVSGVATLIVKKATEGLTLLPGSYNVTASYSGSTDGLYVASQGSTSFKIDITSLPVVWEL